MASKTSSSERKRSRPIEKKKSRMNMKVLGGVAIVVTIVCVAVALVLLGGNSPNENGAEPGENPIAVIDTSKGIIKVELFQDKLPITCGNFIKLVNDGFYDGMIVHRVMDDFMIQAGSTYPDGSTVESPYGNIAFESSDEVSHEDGTISMASTGAGVGGSAQFFICDGNQSGLDGSYAAFGIVVEGIDVVRDIADEPHDSSYGSVGGGRPNEDIIIYSITMEE